MPSQLAFGYGLLDFYTGFLEAMFAVVSKRVKIFCAAHYILIMSHRRFSHVIQPSKYL